MFENTFRRLVQQELRGPLPALARSFLSLIALSYRPAVAFNNLLYDIKLRKINELSRPVVSVGNLTLGGTGKTPFTAWLADWFLARNDSPALVSRGYRAVKKNGQLLPNDEAEELALRIPKVPHFQGVDRFYTAQKLLEQFPATSVFILDDAFQHRKLARTVDILLLDALDPFGCDALFPRGFLREPPEAITRADVVLLSRANLVSADVRRQIRQKAEQFSSRFLWGEIEHSFGRIFLYGSDRPISFDEESRQQLAAENFIACCALGNPEGFRRSLNEAGLFPKEFLVFPDHFRYSLEDMTRIADKMRSFRVSTLVTTMKDFVKLSPEIIRPLLEIKEMKIIALETKINFLDGESTLTAFLNETIKS